MTDNKCRELLRQYEDVVEQMQMRDRYLNHQLEHVLEMIPTMRGMVEEWSDLGWHALFTQSRVMTSDEEAKALELREKFMRWLGFVQGTFACHNIYTIDEMRGHNKS